MMGGAEMILGKLIADYRWANRISVRKLATEIGIPAPTLNRVERGHPCDGATLAAILFWLLAPLTRGPQ